MQQIEDFFKLYEEAAWNKDPAAMLALYHEQAVIFDTWDRGYITSRTEWSETIEDWLHSLGEERVKAGFENITIQQSDTTGFASALIQYQAVSIKDEVLRSMKNRLTLGFSKSEAGWKVVHHHMSAPIGSDTLTAILHI